MTTNNPISVLREALEAVLNEGLPVGPGYVEVEAKARAALAATEQAAIQPAGACSTCYGTGYCVDGKSCPSGCRAPAAQQAKAEQVLKRKLIGYGDCRCILAKYCDGKCAPLFADVLVDVAPAATPSSKPEASELPDLPPMDHIADIPGVCRVVAYSANAMTAYGQLCRDTAPCGFYRAADADDNAPWLTLAHTICADAGLPCGHITDRLKALRDILDARQPGGRRSSHPRQALREDGMSAPHTAGPWRWEFNDKHRSMTLVGGKPQFDLPIMGFARWGMGGAVAVLRDTAHDGFNIMHRVCDRPDWIEPFEGREHHADWCSGVVHPDMRLIAAAPDMLAALRRAVLALAFAAETSPAMRDDYDAVSAAISKATGAPA